MICGTPACQSSDLPVCGRPACQSSDLPCSFRGSYLDGCFNHASSVERFIEIDPAVPPPQLVEAHPVILIPSRFSSCVIQMPSKASGDDGDVLLLEQISDEASPGPSEDSQHGSIKAESWTGHTCNEYREGMLPEEHRRS